MNVIEKIKDITEVGFPSNYALIEIKSKTEESNIALPNGIEEDVADAYSVVISVGESCSRVKEGDIVLLMQSAPRIFEIQNKTYALTYGENMLLTTSHDNIDWDLDVESELVEA